MTVGLMVSKNKEDLPPALPGFEHINRYWDPHQGCYAAKILPGQYFVTMCDELIVTVLGSCVSACIRDRVFGVGGMNHFMLPNNGAGSPAKEYGMIVGDAARYGIYAMELLINEILKNGGNRQNLEVKITGGGKMFANMADVGKRNVEFVRKFLATEGLEIAAEEVGDIYPRKVRYYPGNGKLKVAKMHSVRNDTVSSREVAYLRDLHKQPAQGDIELF